MESTELEIEEKKESSVSKIDRIKYGIVGISYFIAIILSNLGVLFKPLYKKVYYGQANGYFRYGFGIAFLILFYCLIKFVLEKKLNVSYKKDKSNLSWMMTGILFAITFVVIFIICAIIGFEIKPFYDLGNNTTGFKIGISGTELAYNTVALFLAIHMIENFQYALDDIIPFKNEKVNLYLPYGGVATMLTYGIYALCFGIGGSLQVLYFFMIILYGEIYLLCKRNVLKTFASCGLMFIL